MMTLYTFWRSLATMRVRIALDLKGLAAEPVIVDLMAGGQHRPDYAAVNPQKALPALVVDDGPALFQSMAILEYLEETHPEPALLPRDPRARARVRGLAQIAVADAHPLITPRVRQYLGSEFGLTEAQQAAWSKHWMGTALAAIEGHLTASPGTGTFCQGDTVTFADICLVSQVVGHGYFGGTPEAWPTVTRIHQRCMAIPAFARSHPLKQPDAPKG